MAAPSPKGIGADACFASRDIGAYGDEVNARTSDRVGSWLLTEGRRWGHVLTRRAAAGAHYGGTGARRSCKQDRQARPAARAARGGVTPTRRPPSRAAKLRGPARGAPKNQGRNGSIFSAACATGPPLRGHTPPDPGSQSTLHAQERRPRDALTRVPSVSVSPACNRTPGAARSGSAVVVTSPHRTPAGPSANIDFEIGPALA